jgi:alpha-beta hydrolase superfamily lysophospholipase
MKKFSFLLFIFLIGLVVFWYFDKPTFQSTPNPARSYEDALAQFTAIEKNEATLPLSPEGHSRLFVHGAKTEHVFVLLHGLSNCPEQDVALGNILFNQGANVIIPRARDAGFANVLNKEQGNQSGQDLLDQAATGVDIAAGLGNHTTIIAISASALAAAWMAQHRPGIDQVLLLSPFFAPYGKSVFVTNLLSSILLHLPNFYLWKDSQLKAAVPEPRYVYPRWGTYSLASTLALAREVRFFSEPIECKRLSILISAADKTVNNHVTKKCMKKWSRENPEKVFYYEFPASLQVPHDCLDAYSTDISTTIVYPQILKMLE